MPTCPKKTASKKLKQLKALWDEHNINFPLVDIVSSPSIANNTMNDNDVHFTTNATKETTTTTLSLERYQESELVFTSLLGSGSYCDVYKAYSKKHPDRIFAVKKLQPSIRKNRKLLAMCAADLAIETAVLASLHEHNDNIITLRGIRNDNILDSLKSGKFFLCMDPVRETLGDKLERWREEARHRQRLRPFGAVTKKRRMEMNMEIIQRLENVAMGIVRGMEYLHSNHIIYRDLKPENIGFDDNETVKIFDFGLARFSLFNTQQTNFCMTRGIGTPRYMAPEIARGESNYGLAVDVYSFSILLWSLVTNRIAYHDIDNPIQVKEKVSTEYLRPPIRPIPKLMLVSSSSSKEQRDRNTTKTADTTLLQELIESCWSNNPNKRPTFSMIRQQLAHMILLAPVPIINKKDDKFINDNKKNNSIITTTLLPIQKIIHTIIGTTSNF